MDRMDIERNGHERPSDNGTAQGREPKKTKRENAKVGLIMKLIKFMNLNLIQCNCGAQDLKAMTLAELFGALVCSRDEEEIEDIVTEIKKRLDGPLGMQIIVSDEVTTTSALLCACVHPLLPEISSSSM